MSLPTLEVNDTVPNVIEKTTEIAAPLDRVWKAISDYREFGSWFGVALEQPFVPGSPSTGHMTIPGYEHLRWTATVREIVPGRLFSFYWHPYAVDQSLDYSDEEPTLVEFRLEAIAGGTRLTITESGFEHVPAERRSVAYRMNEEGWTMQVERVRAHVS